MARRKICNTVDYCLVGKSLQTIYGARVNQIPFRERVIQAMKERGIKKSELSRASGVSYHALDKFLKREGAETSAENAVKLARALGLKVDEAAEYEELRRLFYRLSPEKREFVLMTLRGLLSDQE